MMTIGDVRSGVNPTANQSRETSHTAQHTNVSAEVLPSSTTNLSPLSCLQLLTLRSLTFPHITIS